MNYLAHIYLSGPDPDIQVGGLLGDFVKGPLTGELPGAIETGIALHRRIDSATDSDPMFREALGDLPSPWRRFGGILLDVYFDHLLATAWHRYHREPLDRFCRTFYNHLSRHRRWLPPRAHRFSVVAPEVHWLENYRQPETVPTMLTNLGKRLRRPVPLGDAWPELEARRDELDTLFSALMTRHLDYSKRFLTHHQARLQR